MRDNKTHSSIRLELGYYHGKEMIFSGKIRRRGKTKFNIDISYSNERTLLLENLCMAGKWINDHIWLNEKEILTLDDFVWEDFRPGTHIRFLGTVYLYITDEYKNKISNNAYNYGIGNIKILDIHYDSKIGCYKEWLNKDTLVIT